MANGKEPFRLQDSPVAIDLDDIKKINQLKVGTVGAIKYHRIEIEFYSPADNLEVEVRDGEYNVLARMIRINMEKFNERPEGMIDWMEVDNPTEKQKVEFDDLYTYIVEQMKLPDPTSGWGWRMTNEEKK